MDLMNLVDDPAIHREILGSYTGPYSLGVASGYFILRVPDDAADNFKQEVTIDGTTVQVEIHRGFVTPQALRG